MRKALLVAALALSLTTPTHAQVSGFTPMTINRVHAIEQRVATVHAGTGTEADFTETWLSAMSVTWRGHAVFSKVGFVLDYTVPAGRRVTSDLSITQVREPSQQYKSILTEGPASRSPYVGLNVLTGVTPSMTSGVEDVVNGVCFLEDRHVSIFVSTSSGLVGRVDTLHRPDIHFHQHSPNSDAACGRQSESGPAVAPDPLIADS